MRQIQQHLLLLYLEQLLHVLIESTNHDSSLSSLTAANYNPKLLSTATNVIQEIDSICTSVLIVKELIAYFGDRVLTTPCRLQNCS
jgi:hypothetical protein